MKVIIDLIEDIRESIQNAETYSIAGMLLKENPENKKDLIYAGEASVGSFYIDEIFFIFRILFEQHPCNGIGFSILNTLSNIFY